MATVSLRNVKDWLAVYFIPYSGRDKEHWVPPVLSVQPPFQEVRLTGAVLLTGQSVSSGAGRLESRPS